MLLKKFSKPFLLLSALDEREALDLLPRDAVEKAADGRLMVAVVVTEVIVGFLFPVLGPPGVLHLDLRHFKGNRHSFWHSRHCDRVRRL